MGSRASPAYSEVHSPRTPLGQKHFWPSDSVTLVSVAFQGKRADSRVLVDTSTCVHAHTLQRHLAKEAKQRTCRHSQVGRVPLDVRNDERRCGVTVLDRYPKVLFGPGFQGHGF